MQAVIMVGGQGVRLRPFTYMIPKPLLPLGGITILEFMIKSLSESGFKEIFLLTSYQHKKFDQCHSYADKYGVTVDICFEGEKLGTAGGITLLRERLNDDFLVLNGDLIVKTDFESMFAYHQSEKADITVGTTEYRINIPHGVVCQDEGSDSIHIQEKPKVPFIVNSGIYALNRSVFELFDSADISNYLDMTALISLANSNNRKVLACDIGDCWLDTGQLDDYQRAVEVIEEWNASY